ncbi:hypothetical protein J7T55_000619 [Diaporthe amygdali]|uniref:uncharacterized protein n=1 Tax=Phomopsis amygdali TaxID=1214568 RepID=UPI0022FE722D|nr:uncharacterized protein J7T55_000619 [Diaporthe amygdali]KAJ0110187.1 hypothetical protein J7T55_000619 [Diaporthe amygdali]
MAASASVKLFPESRSTGRRSFRGGDVDQPSVYLHERLRENDEIRLLNLYPGAPEDTIRANLEIVSINERHNYDAISYTWADENGDTRKCCSIILEPLGVCLPITRNCDSVLRRVRKHTSRVWIDAVCIDQRNIQERGKQVNVMPLIYMGASRTFLYVGEGSDDSALVLGNLSKGIWTPPHLLESFFKRPYFSRVWVVQEVAMSKRITIMCGDIAVEWTKFMQIEHLRRIYTSSFHDTFPTMLRLEEQFISRSATVLDVLVLGRSCEASDTRDKVFALLGLVEQTSANSRLFANYFLSAAEVYKQIAMHLVIVEKRGLDVLLGNLCYRSHEEKAHVPHLPSWVPDWNQHEPTLIQLAPRTLLSLENRFSMLFQRGGRGLFLKGSMLGTLKAFKKTFKDSQSVLRLSHRGFRASGALPKAFNDENIFVFWTDAIPSLSEVFWENRWPAVRETDFEDSATPNLPSVYPYQCELLIARVNVGKEKNFRLSTEWEVESGGNLDIYADLDDERRLLTMKAVRGRKALSDWTGGLYKPESFEFLGVVEILSHCPDPRDIVFTMDGVTIRLV